VSPDKNYQYSKDTRTLFEIVVAPVAVVAETGIDTNRLPATSSRSGAGQLQKRPHLRIKTEETSRQFMEVASRRGQLRKELGLLQDSLVQNEAEFAEYNDALLERFTVSADRDYEYDSSSKILYELVPIPKEGGRQ
jgi:hypothetical protein